LNKRRLKQERRMEMKEIEDRRIVLDFYKRRSRKERERLGSTREDCGRKEKTGVIR